MRVGEVFLETGIREKEMTKTFDRILVVLFWVAGGLLMFVTIGTCVDVLLRYSFNRPISWMLELTEYAMLYIPFLGAAFVLKEDGHIRIDLVITFLSERSRGWLNVVTSFVGGVVMLTYTWFGAQVTLDYFKRGVPSLESLKTPMFFILMIIPIGGLLFSIQFFRQMKGYYQKLKN
jgi:TRAP-type C4-dicarboxylate transport system permease small subunit